MHDTWKFVWDRWRMIKGAQPEIRSSFFALLSAGIIIVGIIVWLGIDMLYRERMHIQDERLAQKDDYIKELESSKAGAGIRDDQALYQEGLLIASVQNPQIDAENQTVIFAIVTASRELDMARSFEFRDWTIVCGGHSTGSVTIGAVQMINYPNVVCRITGNK